MAIDADVEMLRQVLPLWRATRIWAETLLCASLKLQHPSEVLNSEHRGKHTFPGTNWRYRTHGGGVDIDRGAAYGGIDFDFGQPLPDPWRLRIFIKRQLIAGALAAEYAPFLHDHQRFERAAQELLASL